MTNKETRYGVVKCINNTNLDANANVNVICEDTILNELEKILTEKLENAKRDYEIKYQESMEVVPIINKSPLENVSYSLEFSMLIAEIKGQVEAYQDVLAVIQMLEDKENEGKQD